MPVKKKKPKSRAANRAPRGTGTCFYSQSRGCWVARKPIGTRDRNTLYLTRTGDTQAEAIRRRDAALPPGPGVTVAEWMPRWLDSLDVKAQSRDSYRVSSELRIVPVLGHLRVADVTAFHVQEAARTWGRAVGAGTVRNTLAALSAALQAACRAEVRATNPAKAVRRPKAPAPQLDLFTIEELRGIVERAACEPRWALFAVLAATGARAGEALAARPTDYDSVAGTWTITGTLTREHGVGTPKSRHSARTVRVPTAARPAFAGWSPPRSYTVARQRWLVFLRTLGLRARGLHQLRHSVASHAIAAGVPLANVARDLGDTVETLVRVYLHPTPGRDVCAVMDEVLGVRKVSAKAKRPGKPGRKGESN